MRETELYTNIMVMSYINVYIYMNTVDASVMKLQKNMKPEN